MIEITQPANRPPAKIGHSMPISRGLRALSGIEILAVLTSGILAACALAIIHFRGLGIPGHFIIKAALPMMIGFAFVPRRFVGTLMGMVAGLTMLVFKSANVGQFEPVAVTALLAFGPMIDLAMIGKPTAGWKLYLRCGLAGLLTSLIAMAIKWAGPMMFVNGIEARGGRVLDARTFMIFVACGIVAGLLSAAICFRHSSKSTSAKFAPSSEALS